MGAGQWSPRSSALRLCQEFRGRAALKFPSHSPALGTGISLKPPDNILLRDAPRLTKGVIPAGFILQLYEWDEIPDSEDFHDRFFLTDTGGLMIGAGLSAEGSTETTTFTLLDDSHAQALRCRFAANSTVYARVGSAVQVDSKGSASFI